MIHTQNVYSKIIICDGDVTNGETATGTIDTLNYDYATIEVYATTSNNTTNNFSTLTLSEATASNGTYTNVTGFVGDTGFTIAAADTSLPQVVARMNVALAARERWLKLTVTPLTNQAICAVAHLSYKDETPTGTNVGAAVVATG